MTDNRPMQIPAATGRAGSRIEAEADEGGRQRTVLPDVEIEPRCRRGKHQQQIAPGGADARDRCGERGKRRQRPGQHR